jgi:hypothetical protein
MQNDLRVVEAAWIRAETTEVSRMRLRVLGMVSTEEAKGAEISSHSSYNTLH